MGGGVSVGGSAVKVGTVGVGDWMMGWNGVGVAEAFGSTVIRLTGGRGGAEGAIPQAESRTRKRTMKARRFFMRCMVEAFTGA